MKLWCCSLDTTVGMVGGVMAALYLVMGVVAVVWVVFTNDVIAQNVGRVIEVNTFDDVYQDLRSFEEIDNTLVFLILALVISALGIVTSLILIIGVMRSSSCMLLPWLAWHVVIVLCCLGSGLYLLVYFLLLVDEIEEEKAVASAGPVLAGILLIFLWVLVDQLYLHLKQTQLTIQVGNILTSSSTSLNNYQSYTIRSNMSSSSNYSGRNKKPLDKVKHIKRTKQLKRKSRSLEHIMDSLSNLSNSSFHSDDYRGNIQAIKTLPHMKLCRDKTKYSNNTIRSVSSAKSVSIHPQVTEYHYQEHQEKKRGGNPGEEWEDGVSVDFSDETDEEIENIDMQISTVPRPIYPTLDSKQAWTNRRTLTKEQIIDLYCPSDVAL